MDIDELRAFVAVVEEGSFSAAAKAEGVARTSLRRRVDALEARVGRPLMHRGASGVVLTSTGKRLFEEGQALQRQAEQLLRRARETDDEAVDGVIDAVVPIGTPIFSHVLAFAEFQSRWPKLRHRVRFAETPSRASRGQADVLMWMGPRELGPDWEVLVEQRFPCRLMGAERYLAGRPPLANREDLDGHVLLEWINEQWPAKSWPTRVGDEVSIEPAMTTSHLEMLQSMVAQGMGLALLPIFDPGAPRPENVRVVLEDTIGTELRLRTAVRVGSLGYALFKALSQNLPDIMTPR